METGSQLRGVSTLYTSSELKLKSPLSSRMLQFYFPSVYFILIHWS